MKAEHRMAKGDKGAGGMPGNVRGVGFAKRKVKSLEKKKALFGYLFSMPLIIGVTCFFLPALVLSMTFSLSKLSIVENGYSLDILGINNYRYIFAVDPNFRQILINSIKDMLINVPVVVIFSLFLATLLNQKFKGRAVIRAILFLPVIISSGAIVSLSQIDIMQNLGAQGSEAVRQGADLTAVFSGFMTGLEISPVIIGFLVDIVSRVYSITMMSAVPIIILLAALQSVSSSIFEAAHVEGATKWEVFWKISFPMVSPMLLVSCVYCVVDSMTNISNKVIDTIHKKTFTEFDYGVGSAMAWSYLLLVFLILGAVYAVINKRVYYYD